MKRIPFKFMMIIIGILFLNNSCINDYLPEKMGNALIQAFILYNGDSISVGGALVNIYKTEEDMNNNVVYLSGTTAMIDYETEGIKFNDIPIGNYIIKVTYSEASGDYSNEKVQIYFKVIEGNNIFKIHLRDTALDEIGDLQVIVRQENATGFYIGGAIVELFRTENERTQNYVYLASTTDVTDPIMVGAIFSKLPTAKYYLRAHYQNTSGEFTGIGEATVPKGITTKVEIVCTQ
jgi:hypothetical protein